MTLTFTAEEWHDLQVVASIPRVDMMGALRMAPRGLPGEPARSQTYDVYGLLTRIKATPYADALTVLVEGPDTGR